MSQVFINKKYNKGYKCSTNIMVFIMPCNCNNTKCILDFVNNDKQS